MWTVPLKSSYCSQFGTKGGEQDKKNKKRSHVTVVKSKAEGRTPQCVSVSASQDVPAGKGWPTVEAQQQSEES